MGNVGNRKICVVKDDPFLRLECVSLLEEAGLPVAGFASPERALAFFDRHAEDICLVVAELSYPNELTGLQLAQQVAAKWPWINVVAVSESRPDSQISENVIVMTKPWLPTELLAHAFRASRGEG
ncbi:Response regulator receiver domain-containing protein [Rhizobiales bacterium GAS191]|nr:Response regulator receiver domain-containing protein [Rhizobiales bacterium GAS191]